MHTRTTFLICVMTTLAWAGALAQAPHADDEAPRPAAASASAPATASAEELQKQLAELQEAAGWERVRLKKEINDLRVELAAKGTLDYRKIKYPSTDALPIPAYLFKPLAPAKEPVPAVIVVHGSQHGQFNYQSVPWVADLVAKGWIVLAPDYRGSMGYTKEFYDAADYGGREIDDMRAARDFLAAMPDVDPARIAILGMSHGGYNALMALALYPGKFAAGVDFFGPTDLVWRLTTKDYPYAEAGEIDYFASMVGKRVDEAPELYRARSPRYLADRIDAPLLILHGDQDSIVPIQESKWMVEALKKAGNRDFSFYVMKGGEHGYPKPQMAEGWQQSLAFLEKVLATPPHR